MDAAQASLLGWLDAPDPVRGIRFARPGDDWEHWPYARLADHARCVAAGLRAYGVRPGDVVSLVQRSGPDFVGGLFGAMLAGATPSPIAPPLTFQDRDAYRDHVGGLVGAARPAAVLADADLVDALVAIIAATHPVPVRATDAVLDAAGGDRLAEPAAGGLALLQFTSGSSGVARGVRVPFEALDANVTAIRAWLAMTPDDPTASWLPIHHDMGLIGCLITPVVNGSDLWLLAPEDFVHTPLRYLTCFGAQGARLTSMPNFGLEYIARRVPAEALAGLDFSAWRAVIMGAERIDAAAVRRFCALLGPHGLDERALLPAYGLAEATLAVTGLPLPERWSSRAVRASRLALGRSVCAPAGGEPEPVGEEAAHVAGCGRPLSGVTVRVVDEQRHAVADGVVGEIAVSGASVAAGYLPGTDSDSQTAFVDGVLYTADAGFLLDGQLFVLGRLGDSLKLRGRSLFAEELELAFAQAGVPGLRMAALLGYRSGTATVVAVFENAKPEWLVLAEGLLRRRTEGADVVLVDAPRGTIARTSSGKPRRRQLWRAFVAESLPGTVVSARPYAAGLLAGGKDD